MNEYKSILRNSNFISLWTSQLLSQVTINIMNFLLLLKLFEGTGSTIATSFLWVAYSLPAIIVGPFAAATIDMVDRRKTLIWTNFFQAVTIFLYALSHEYSLFLLYGVAMIYSLINQFYVPAEQASLPSIVSKSQLPQANGFFFLTQQAAIILGFGFAGIMARLLGFELSLYLCAIFIFTAFLSVTMLPDMKPRDSVPANFERALRKFFQRIIDGYIFIKDNRAILAPFLILIGLQVMTAVIIVNAPLMATQILKIQVETVGLLMVVPAGLGAALSSLSTPKFMKRGVRKRVIIETNFILLALSLVGFSLVVPLFVPNIIRILGGFIAVFLSGYAFVGIVIPSQTFLQEKTPGGYRGRVFGNFWFLVTVATVIPVIISGTVSELFGIKTLLTVLGLLTFVSFLAIKKYGTGVISKAVLTNEK